ncbi:NUDIX domain-containing protein [Pontibacter sp. G13]|uniref:NUDIX hydrolase n=1 Tax=Pontibacter sp. G13 TaxID=3074898 RepID=UPI00288C449D|nr:NUDIX domain-containing protein [Pontibacter sp. G13]WNJ20550.1 NUDIX domain-containing protein [Pontibacter sp. G13]
MKIPYGLKKVATLCVLQHKDEFLLLRRKKDPNAGLITPVGGKLDPHESPLTCAIRETREETGIILPSMKFCGMLTESSPTHYNWVNYVYLGQIDRMDPPPCNEGELLWVHRDHLLGVDTPKTDWFIYEYLLADKPFMFSAEFDSDIVLQTMREELENVFVWPREG